MPNTRMLAGGRVIHASESGHWYGRDGLPHYEVIAANGEPRAATLRDARKFGWFPGVTTILRCAAAPNLERWKRDQLLLAVRTLPRRALEDDESFFSRAIIDAEEEARKARERGTEIHAAIQGHYEGRPPPVDLWPYVQGVAETIAANFGEQAWIAEKPVAHQLGFGTKSDLHAEAVIDFKGKDFTRATFNDVKTWDDHAMQLAATREALQLPGAPCAIVYVSRTEPGLAKVCHIDEMDLVRGWDMFRGLLNYWKAKNKYWPELWRAKEAEAA